MSASYEVDPGVSFERVDNGWGLGIYIYHQKVMKSYDKDVLFERTSMEKYLYIRVHNIFIFVLRSKTGKAKE